MSAVDDDGSKVRMEEAIGDEDSLSNFCAACFRVQATSPVVIVARGVILGPVQYQIDGQREGREGPREDGIHIFGSAVSLLESSPVAINVDETIARSVPWDDLLHEGGEISGRSLAWFGRPA